MSKAANTFIMKNQVMFRELLATEKAKQAKNRWLFKGTYCRDYLNYVCVDEMGKLLRPNYVTEHFGWVIRKYGLRKIRFHDLRHTYAASFYIFDNFI